MINDIVDAVCVALFNEFSDEYEIYTELIKQGVKEPCFFVHSSKPKSEIYLGKRFKKTNQINIQYFPSKSEKNLECNDVLERLYQCLSVLDYKDLLVRGSNMQGNIVDEVLNFSISYNFFTYEEDEVFIMEKLERK